MTIAVRSPKDVIARDGSATLYRFRSDNDAAPVLLIPSMINRWYVLDLDEGSSVAAALVEGGHDVYLLDWGGAADEDRYLAWDEVIDRLGRAVRRTLRHGGDSVALLGYCMGGTLAAIYTALFPDKVHALVNLAGPIDFSEGGLLRTMVDARWFDAGAVAAAGNVSPAQMQSGFAAMRPTLDLAKSVRWIDRGLEQESARRMTVLEEWASDNVAFPAAAYTRYIGDLYQQNQLYEGSHYIRGRRVDLGAIQCPLLTIVAERDTICPSAAAPALNQRVSSSRQEVVTLPGGHVGAVVGGAASKRLYPKLVRWFHEVLPTPLAAE